MVINPIKFIFLFFCLFSFILSQTSYQLKESVNIKGEGSVTYEIKTEQAKGTYIHIKVDSQSKQNQIVFACSDQNCDKRMLIGIQQNGLINLFIKQKQATKVFYLLVQCAEEDTNCKYNLDLISETKCELLIGEQTSYYSYDNSQEMNFIFKPNNDINPEKVIFWVKGQTIQTSSLKIGNEEIAGNKFGYGNVFSSKYDESKTYEVKVVSNKQDYITVGSLYIKDEISKTIAANDLEIMGILNKGEEKICFNLKTIEDEKAPSFLAQIEGIIFNKRAKVYFTNLQNENDKINPKEIENGQILEHIVLSSNNQRKTFCIEAIDKYKDDNVIFSIQLISNVLKNYSPFIYAPQLPGVIYRHFLPKGTIGIYRSMTPTLDSTDINFNMKAIKGFPDMKIDQSIDFPISNYNDPIRISSFKNPHNSNRITVYYIDLEQDKNKYELFNKRQDLIVVECLTGSNQAEIMSPYCEFETLIFSNKDRVNLIEKDSLSQFLVEGEEDLYTLDISKEENLEKVYLDVIVFSGDVNFVIESDDIAPENAHKYFISNKIFYSIHVDNSIKKINSRVTAEKNSFYMIQYQLARSEETDESKNTYKIDSGINYIQSIYVGDNSDYMKYIDFENLKYEVLSPFFVNFYSENCDFVVSKRVPDGGEESEHYDYLDMEGNYVQHIIDENDRLFDLDTYRFKIEITGTDVSEYNDKLCMFYITGVELSNTNNETERTISVSEGVPQHYIFKDNHNSLKYSYHISDKSKSIIINLNLIDKASYTVSVKHNYNDIIEPKTIYRNQQIIISSSILDNEDPNKKICKEEDVVCTIDIFVDLNREGDNNDKYFELTINQIKGAPTYLQKNVVKQDVLIGSERKYYYYDIGKGETGDITIDYVRGGGHIYAQIVKKKLDEKMEDAEWRGIFNFPKSKTEENGLPYKTYFKKIEINEDDTKDCDEGCFVLISVESSLYQEEENKEENLTPYRITITPRVFPNGISYLPKVTIPLNQFIIGNIYKTGNEIKTFYKVFIPYDSDFIIFDWQADMCTLLINVGDERPDFSNEIDFTIKPGQDHIIKLKKQEVLEKLKDKTKNSLKNLQLTIGIWSDRMDTLDSSTYAFKIFVPKTNDGKYSQNIYETIHIRSDQKVQCRPNSDNDGHFYCVFAVVFDDCDAGKNLVVYPRAQKENVQVKFYGNVVQADKVEKNNLEFINEQIKNKNNAQFTSDHGDKFIYYEGIEKEKSVLFEVDVEDEVDIEILSSTYQYTDDLILIPNPSTPQVFSIGEKKIQFNFETSKDLLINIVSISGSGSFYWGTGKNEEIKYYLNDFEDRLTLTSGIEDDIDKYANLIVQSSTFTDPEINKSGFTFYMTFYPRNNNYNIDQVKIGRSTEFNYRQVKFPLYYYTKLTSDEVLISFTFYNYFMKREERFPYDKKTYSIYSKIITEEEALDARLNGNFPSKTGAIKGEFDGAFATLYLDYEKINSFNIRTNPYLIFWVEFDDTKSELFNGISVEITLLESSFFAPQSVYINGKLSEDETNSDPIYYKLKADQEKKFMRVEFSANSNYVKWGVSSNKDYNSNTGILSPEESEENGRKFLTFEVPEEIFKNNENTLYLVVHWDNGKIKKDLGNYIFKYMNAISRENFFTFPQEEDKVDYSIIKKGNLINYEISFSPVEQYDVNYYVKAVYKKSLISGEKKDSIAISSASGRYLQVDNPYFDGGNAKVNFTLENISEEIAYIKILAKVNLNSIKEFLLYKPIDISNEGQNEDPNYKDMPASKSLIQLTFDYEKEIKLNYNEAYKLKKYEVKFENEIPNYIKVRVKRNSDNNQQIISFYPKQGDEANRLQLAQSRFGDTVTMWIKKEQIENKLLYYTIECQNEDSCKYKIDIFGYDLIQIDSYNFNYNYYVSKNNQKMEFRINNNLDIEKIQGQIITLYATGGKDIKLSLSNCLDDSCKQYSFSTGAAITKEIQKHYYFDLTIEGKDGDFISVGSKVTGKDGDPVKVDGEVINNVLKPNNYQFTGYLRRDILPKDCHLMPDDKDGYIAAIFYNKNAEISFKNKDFNDVKDSNEIQNKGYYSYIHDHNSDKRYICIGLPPSDNYEIENLAYSLQLTQKTEETDLLNLYAPQITGNIYPRIIPKGSIVFFNAANLKEHSEEISYNMIATEGLPRMYMLKCKNYPLCQINNKEIEKTEGINEISEINRISTWHTTEIENNSPIDSNQNILVVKCEDLKDSGTDICQFQTSIYGDKDEIHLIEGQTFSQYIYAYQKTQYIIDFSMEKTITKVYVDTLVISGDVSFILHDNQNNEIDSHKYYLSNKIFYSISLNNDANKNIRRIIVDIEAKVNSYYIIEYKLTRGKTGETTNDIYNGINYLIPISSVAGENNKLINIHSFKLLKEKIQFVSFYSLNCDIKIKKIKNDGTEQSINSYGNYGQDVYKETNAINGIYSYHISASGKDISQYENNMCMLYVSGLEITDDAHSSIQKEILIGDGIPQRAFFNHGLKKLKFIYPNPNKDKNIAVYFKVISPGNFSYSIAHNQYEYSEPKTIYQTQIEYLDKSLCDEENEFCNIIVSVYLNKDEMDYVPTLEVTIKQINSQIPYYIPKGIVRQDFVPSKSTLYLFTTLGKNDQGFITVNFARGSGLIYAKIVPIKPEKGKEDKDPEWRQYKFPSSKDESLYYEFYNKRLRFNTSDTDEKKCQNGCYLLLSIQSSAKGNLDEQYRFHQFSITISLTPPRDLVTNGQIISIEPEEYVIGSLADKEMIKKNQLYEYYKVIIPYNADKIEFDWQSDSAILFINIGEKRTDLKNSDFKFSSRGDTIFELTNKDIKDKLIGDSTIANTILTIGVYTEDYESSFGTPYSFRVHFSKGLNIHKVSSDQKTLCKPEKVENKNEYRCLYMITYGELDFIYDLMIYSRSQSPSGSTYMYAKFIPKEIYDSFDEKGLKENMPNDSNGYNTKKEKIDFIFLTLSEIGSHFFISVISDQPEIIEFITSFKTFDNELSPNPSSIQLFSINNGPSMRLKFITTQPLIINIVSLYGSSKLYFEDSKNIEYSLRGRDDRISFAIPSSGKEAILMIEDRNYKDETYDDDQNLLLRDIDDEKNIKKPSLAFYLEYYLRSLELNFDEIFFGKTVEFIYPNSDFPLYYYSKLNNLKTNINTFFILHDLDSSDNNMNGKEIKSSDIEFKGYVIKEKTIYLVKVNKDSKPSSDKPAIVGIYDPALQVGQLLLSQKEIQSFNIHEEEKPTIYLSLEKKNSQITYKKIRAELSAIQENNDIPVTEKLYQYGKIKEVNELNYYRLKVDNSTGDMRIQFSTNSKHVDFAINEEKEKRINMTLKNSEIKQEKGKVFITFNKPENKEYIYLNVFLKSGVKSSTKIVNNYVFKYINAGSRDTFFEYNILNNDRKLIKEDKGNGEFSITFNKIDSNNVDIIYSLKAVKNDTYKNELFDTIALIESQSTVIQTKNPQSEKITLSMKNNDYSHFQVIAQIINGPIIEYVSYEPLGDFSKAGEPYADDIDNKDSDESEEDSNDDDSALVAVIIISIILLVVVIILVVVIMIFNAKNKNLMEQVNKISFIKSGAKPKEDVNLLLDNQNELE